MSNDMEVDRPAMALIGRDHSRPGIGGTDMAALLPPACEGVLMGDDWLPAPGEKVVIRDTRVDARHPRGLYVLTRIG